MDRLLTRKDLAERWQVTERTIDEYRATGVISQIKGIPAIRFNPQYIAELEGTKIERFSPLERRRLENEIDRLEKENQELRQIAGAVLAESAKLGNIINRKFKI